jgi:hypothetical protein
MDFFFEKQYDKKTQQKDDRQFNVLKQGYRQKRGKKKHARYWRYQGLFLQLYPLSTGNGNENIFCNFSSAALFDKCSLL